MTKQEISLEYIKRFCKGNINGIKSLLSPDMKFSGPFHSFNSAKEYLESLRKEPPEKSDYQIVSITENKNSVALFYEYRKPNKVMKVAQLFVIEEEKIKKILLVFDGRGFDYDD